MHPGLFHAPGLAPTRTEHSAVPQGVRTPAQASLPAWGVGKVFVTAFLHASAPKSQTVHLTPASQLPADPVTHELPCGAPAAQLPLPTSPHPQPCNLPSATAPNKSTQSLLIPLPERLPRRLALTLVSRPPTAQSVHPLFQFWSQKASLALSGHCGRHFADLVQHRKWKVAQSAFRSHCSLPLKLLFVH